MSCPCLVGYINPVCGALGAAFQQSTMHTVDVIVAGVFMRKGGAGAYATPWTGYGKTYHSALRVGLLEGMERYVGLAPRAKKTAVFDCLKNLQADALNPLECGLYQPTTYRANPSLTPFGPELVIPWVWGYSFRHARPLLVPEQLAYYNTSWAQYPYFVRATSNGCAAGSSSEEAILFGLWELLERDGFLMTWYTGLSPRRIDPWSCRQRSTLDLLDRFDLLGYDVHLLDTRFDIPVPSIVAVAVSRQDGYGKLAVGARANFDPEQAIHGALVELGSIANDLTVRAQRRLDELHAMEQDYSKVVSLEDHGTLYALPSMAAKAAFLFQNPELLSLDECYRTWLTERPQSYDLRHDLQYCIERILERGMDVIVVEQTSPEQERAGLKMFNVIVPGLLPIDFGWDKVRVIDLPRLRTAPRLAGYLATNFDPAQCNLAPHPFF